MSRKAHHSVIFIKKNKEQGIQLWNTIGYIGIGYIYIYNYGIQLDVSFERTKNKE